jgi:sugar lactone lactonase YvrE
VRARHHTLLEAPRVTATGGVLFSDVLAGGVFRLEGDVVSEVIPGRRSIGGLVEHADGGIVVSGRDVIHGDRVLLDRPDATGFNDLTTTPGGGLVVGSLRYRPLAGEPAVPGELLRLDPDGEVTVLSEDLDLPNGVGVAGERVYVSDYAREHVLTLGLDGSAAAVFADVPRGSADGLALDVEGGVWVALGPGAGVARFTAAGELDAIVDVPAAFVSSLCFRGEDVVVTAVGTDGRGLLFRGRSEIAGAPVAPARV